MVTDAMRKDFERALTDARPQHALYMLAMSLKAEGVDQITIYRLFAEYQPTVDGSDAQNDAIVDNMDLIWGGSWAKGSPLFDTELKDADIA